MKKRTGNYFHFLSFCESKAGGKVKSRNMNWQYWKYTLFVAFVSYTYSQCIQRHYTVNALGKYKLYGRCRRKHALD